MSNDFEFGLFDIFKIRKSQRKLWNQLKQSESCVYNVDIYAGHIY